METTTKSNSDKLLTLRQGAEYLTISPRTLRRMIDRNEIPYYYIGSSLRLRANDLEEYLELNRFGPR